MSVPFIKFNITDRPEFIKELRKKVNSYFKENNLSKHADTNMKLKTVFMIFLYFTPLILMLTGLISSLWLILFMWTIMGFGMAGIGLSIMHDANHESYSKNKKVNKALGFLVNFLGAYHVNWKIQHNVLHHTFTNVDGFDDDINVPVLRLSPKQKSNKWYRFQAFYASFLYGMMTINWLLFKDFVKLIQYKKQNLLEGQGLTLTKAMLHLIINKLWYVGITLVLPLIIVDLPWWQMVLGFVLMQFICGLILSYIFQLAHVIEETNFYEADVTGSLENNWAIHQMNTTANFADKSVLFSWFIGGLNYQIEHHLFPNICHVHYKKLSKIVKQTALEFDIPYYQHKTFFSAIKSHFSLLNQLGTGKYDLKNG